MSMDRGFPYGFPFAPYSIQEDLMAALHDCLDKRAVGFFESPTGTGKSLSLICGLLSWLERNRFALAPLPAASEMRDPLAAHKQKMLAREHDARVLEQKQQREKLYKAMTGAGDASWADGINAAKHRNGAPKRAKPAADDLDAWLLPDDPPPAPRNGYDGGDGSSDDDDGGDGSSDDDDGIHASGAHPLERPATTAKIFYTSRTHSQLKQFVGELQRTRYKDTTLVASMGARTTLCVHEPVKGSGDALRSAAAINDACQDLRDKRGGCPCNRMEAVRGLALRSLRSVLHVEELAKEGLVSGACAYYASRDMMTQADVVVLPYQMLFHAGTRAALGLSLQDAIVVIDEAHNVTDAINDVHSAQLSAEQIAAAGAMLDAYVERYATRLSEENKAELKKIRSFVAALGRFPAQAKDDEQQRLLSVESLMFALNEDQLNPFKMAAYIRERRLANMMRGFHAAYAATVGGAAAPETKGAFHALTSFLDCLANKDDEGRILVQFRPRFRVEYLLLSPGRCFAEMAQQCRAVVLAGGTLSPFEVLTKQLVPHVGGVDAPPSRALVMFSCGHVVPPSSLLVLAVGKAPTDRTLDFSFHNRGDKAMEDLHASLANLRRLTPAGMVVFFPSYAFEGQFHDYCAAKSGALASVGSPFRGDGDIFKAYSESIRSGARATLWAVVGGSLSEGINFSDDLGRCVVMVGVPFPNSKDVVLQARLARLGDGHYDALAARAVNQSIGRAIRHIADYACVVLLDARYEQLAPKWLPAWMKQSLVQHSATFGGVPSQITSFFRGKRVALATE